jgi:ABC-type nitrate/sulfonate/bicarbonate transport system ATPase subunit
MTDPSAEEMQVWIAKGISPTNKTRLMVEHGIPADVLDAIEVLVMDGYPWRNAIDVAAAMKRNGGKPVVEQARHFVLLRQATR